MFIQYFGIWMDAVEEIKQFAEGKLAPGQFIVDVIVSSRKGPKKVSVIIDGDQGVSIDDCAELSRHISNMLDETNLVEDNFTLEVSTPGLDHPLRFKRQYVKNIGRSLKVKVGETMIEGRLEQVLEDKITLLQELGTGKNKEIKKQEILLSEIEKAFVMVSFK